MGWWRGNQSHILVGRIGPITGAICKPTYSIERANVIYHHTDQAETINVDKPQTTSGKQLNGLHGSMLCSLTWGFLGDSNSGNDLNRAGILDFASNLFDREFEPLLDVSTMLNVT